MVTGGARGIGLATAQRLLRDGTRCVIWDRDQVAIDAAKAKLVGLQGSIEQLGSAADAYVLLYVSSYSTTVVVVCVVASVAAIDWRRGA